MDAHLRAGIAIYNAGGHHAAHDAWEDHWLELESGSDDERFLHGLIQFTAAVHHGGRSNWEGVQGLAESAGAYLDGLPSPCHGVDLDPVRDYLAVLADEPRHFEGNEPPQLRYRGEVIRPADLDFDSAAVAAEVLAEERDAYDEAVLEDAVRYAREAIEAEGPTAGSGGEDPNGADDPGGADRRTDSTATDADGRFVALVMDFVGDGEHRDLVYQRLTEHVERRRGRESDVEGLFDESG